MGLYLYNGAILVRAGELAGAESCCCDGCQPCPECSFPPPQYVPTYAQPTGQCAVNFFPPGGDILTHSVARYYSASLPDGVTWKPGAQEALGSGEGCNWAIVTDEVFVTCCCAIPVEQGQTLQFSRWKRRHRLLVIACPPGEPAYFVDKTSAYLSGDMEPESPDFPGGGITCSQPPECYAWPSYLPDESPDCNEFP